MPTTSARFTDNTPPASVPMLGSRIGTKPEKKTGSRESRSNAFKKIYTMIALITTRNKTFHKVMNDVGLGLTNAVLSG